VLSFELSAIDLILGIAVILLLILYLTKFLEKPQFKGLNELRNSLKKPKKLVIKSENENVSKLTTKKQTNCPRGFGDIKKFNEDNSVSERCLSCHLIIECFSENNDNK
jgi:hypothetical protein